MIYDWLKSHTNFEENLTPNEIRQLFTLHSFEVDGFESNEEKFKNIIIGEIKSLKKHPNADALKICGVYDGEKNVQIVCGGSNLFEGQLVALCQEGAKVMWHGTDEVIIKNTEIRGEKSFGMIAASDEIGLGESKGKEILDLSHVEAKAGQSLVEALNLPKLILDIDNKSITNRPDLWSVEGLAREFSAITKSKFFPVSEDSIIDLQSSEKSIQPTEINQDIFKRFNLLKISNLQVTESPLEIQNKLKACGIKIINNIVDASNYVMLELGQPTHAFDANKINLEDINITFAKKGDKFEGLDNKTYELNQDDAVLKSNNQVQSLLGIMGSNTSAVDKSTKEILLESACFKYQTIRKSSKSHFIRTDSVQRFEKQTDPNLCLRAIYRFIEILKLSCPQLKIASKLYENYPEKVDEKTINLEIKKVESTLGIKISNDKILNILNSLGFETEDLTNNILVKVPTFRSHADINFDYDLIEEIGRIYGYNNIKPVMPIDTCKPPMQYKRRNLTNEFRQSLKTEGFHEVINYSFQHADDFKKNNLDIKEAIQLENYLSSEQTHLRTDLLPNLIKNLNLNLKNQDNVNLFEFGRTYIENKNNFPIEEKHLGMISTSKESFYSVKSAIKRAFKEKNIDLQFEVPKSIPSYLIPNASAIIKAQGQEVGVIGLISPIVLNNNDIKEKATYLNINFGKVSHLKFKPQKIKDINKFPSISFDLSILCDKKTLSKDFEKAISKASNLVTNIEVFDIYEGENIASDKKAIAYKVTIESHERTLTNQDLENCMKQSIENINKAGGEIRGA